MLSRYFISFQLAALITFGLFFAMQSLISNDEIILSEPRERPKVIFGKVRGIVEPTDDIVPPILTEIPKPPETQNVPVDNGGSISPVVDTFLSDVKLISKPSKGSGGSVITEGDFVAILMPGPKYPTDLAEKGVEGFVRVRYTVTEIGTTENVTVVSSSNRSFERSAVRAAEKFKFKPRIEDGKAILVPDVYNMIEFQLEN